MRVDFSDSEGGMGRAQIISCRQRSRWDKKKKSSNFPVRSEPSGSFHKGTKVSASRWLEVVFLDRNRKDIGMM